MTILQNPRFSTVGRTNYINSGRTDRPAHVVQSPTGWRVDHFPVDRSKPVNGLYAGWVYVRSSPPGLAIDSNHRATRTTIYQEDVVIPVGTHFVNLEIESHMIYTGDLHTVGVRVYLEDVDDKHYGMTDHVWLPRLKQGRIEKGTHNFSVEWETGRYLHGKFVIEVWVKWGSTLGELRILSCQMEDVERFQRAMKIATPALVPTPSPMPEAPTDIADLLTHYRNAQEALRMLTKALEGMGELLSEDDKAA